MDREDQIEEAVDTYINRLVDSWQIPKLLPFAINDRLDYYLNYASDEEVNQLLKDYGKEEDETL